MAVVARINITPVKGLGLLHPDEIELGPAGVEENRRFYLISSDRGLLFNGKDYGPLVRIRPELVGDSLALQFPGGEVVSGEVALGHDVTTDFWGRPVAGRVVQGPWAAALSEFAGTDVLLVRTEDPGSGSDVHIGTLVARASSERLAQELDAPVDSRRFRMLLELDGLAPHEEDGWRDRPVRIGDAVVRIRGPVPRCAVTTQDPDTGIVTLDTLRGIKNYRGLGNGKAIDFGVYFDVEQPGSIRVGAAVELV